MKYAVVEDEIYAREHLMRLLGRLYPGWTNVFSCESVAEALEFLSADPEVDLLFMDIELTDGNCFDIFSRIEVKVPVIFTTAYDEYALQAFKVSSIDYLLKPVTEEDVRAAVDKYNMLRGKDEAMPAPDLRRIAEMLATPKHKRILTTSGDNFAFVDLEDIAWFQVEDDYVFAMLRNGTKRLTTHTSLSKLSEELPPDEFFKLSRNMIASIGSIAKVSKHFRGRLHVKLSAGANETECMVSAAQRDMFLDWLGH